MGAHASIIAQEFPETPEIVSCKEKLFALFETTPCMPGVVRLAWHDAGTYNAEDCTGGANASIRHMPEKEHGANAGLPGVMELLEPVKTEYPEMSYADFYQFASIAAIEFAGGPKIPFRLGRKDATETACTPDDRLPDATKGAPHLRDIFYRMGMNDQEIVALSGAHSLGRAHKDRSGFDDKPWTPDPLKFSNDYFQALLDEPKDELLVLPTDKCLVETPEFKPLVEKYAASKEAFFEDYARAHFKLSELGFYPETATIKAIKDDLFELFKANPCMPGVVRLAWHDAGTYNKADKTGGANASIRMMPEKEHGANAGLPGIMEILEPIKTKFEHMSYADFYQLAGVAAIEFAGGPKIPFKMGRKDATEAECTPDDRLPDATKGAPHLRDIFYRMGMNDQEIVALSGAHSLGRAHKDRSGFDDKPWTPDPLKFSNDYFQALLDEPKDELLVLPTDKCLIETAEFKPLVEKYAASKEAFFEDYVKAHLKLSQLGVSFS